MTYPASVRFLYSLGNEVRTIKLGLERIRALSQALGDVHRACRFVHVAGTNGKGSTCAMIASGLRAARFRTMLFTSPHLVEPVERIQIDGRAVSTEQFTEAFEKVHEAAERMLALGTIDFHPTYFETVTAMALTLARDLNVTWGVIEVGLGGRLDATNIIEPELSVITPIDYDHEAFLGKSIAAIATEKAGIIKPSTHVLLAPQRREAEAVLRARAVEAGAPVTLSSDWQIDDLILEPAGCRFSAIRGATRLNLRCPLAGEHQVTNALTAAAALDLLGLPAPPIESGLADVHWPGRLERVATDPEIILDGAHNPAGARVLAAHIRRFYQNRRVWLIYGAMRDKAVAEVASILFEEASEVILTAPDQSRAVRPQAVREMLDEPDLKTAPTLKDAIAMAKADATPGDVIFITGSLFLIGEAKRLFSGPHVQ